MVYKSSLNSSEKMSEVSVGRKSRHSNEVREIVINMYDRAIGPAGIARHLQISRKTGHSMISVHKRENRVQKNQLDIDRKKLVKNNRIPSNLGLTMIVN